MTTSQLQSLEKRLDSLFETHKSTIQLVNRLANLKIEPGSISLEAGHVDARSELTAEIHEILKREDEDLEALKQEVSDSLPIDHSVAAKRSLDRDNNQASLQIQIKRLEEDFRIARTRFRAAQVQSKRNAQLARAQERDLLFTTKSQGAQEETPLRRRNQDKSRLGINQTVAASSDVTAALRRTHQLLQTEVQRSHFAQEIFNTSSEAIKNLSESYNDLDTLLASSKTLLTTLVKSNKSDTWYLETSFYILLATIAWLVFRRFLYGPLWWFAWLPLKFIYSTIFTIFGLVGIGGRASTTALSATASSITQSSSIRAIPSSSMSPASNTASDKKVSETPLADEIGNMVDQNREEKKEPVIRGDGTVLKSSDAPRNPKKKMWEERVDQPSGGAQPEGKSKDEL